LFEVLCVPLVCDIFSYFVHKKIHCVHKT
jgi:hypothetical protein